ncbi:c-type cytochrome domain-containing protein [Engelhardtia mirabilis]|uniref:Planctomycete cytochrome C n=1 Tax=Engelhardtia mirabilis TaxID=2528011 RepID=A0A518BF10_9BACT|nr:Planctomycete cytochrome C [Planctomycetes bacterium Pla133]QDU99889.1 Planctomycete cytochrome C [Planctomycetes bacterium Pla86]
MDSPTGTPLDAWLDLLAALHVAVVHFPVALILAAALFETGATIRGLVRDEEARPSSTALACLILGALGAAASAASGWTLADRENFGSSMAEALLWHRWTGVTVAGLALLALLPGAMTAVRPSLGARRLYRTLLLLAAMAVSLAGHQGGAIVHGSDHITGPLRRALYGAQAQADSSEGSEPASDSRASAAPIAPQPALVDPAHSSPPAALLSVPDDPEALAVAARAVLGSRCVECHGPRKEKGDLRLDTRAAIVDVGYAAFPGDGSGSPIIERVVLPIDHEDHMPSEGPPLNSVQVDVLRAWIDAGVRWPADGQPAQE